MKSRYSNNIIIDNNHYGTWSYPVSSKGYITLDLLDGVQFTTHTVQFGDRLDIIAAKAFNEDTYDWVIMLCNNILWKWQIKPGDVLKIPIRIEDVLEKLFP